MSVIPQQSPDPQAVRAARRTRVAFTRLKQLVEQHPELPLSEWLVFVARRAEFALAQENGIEQAVQDCAVEYRRERKRRKRFGQGKRKAILERLLTNGRQCAYCDKELKRATIDHVRPLCKRGTNADSNLVAACEECNHCKGNRTPLEWAADILAVQRKAHQPQEMAEVIR